MSDDMRRKRSRRWCIDGVRVSGPEARAHVRRRDGDLCWLCGKVVEEGLPPEDKLSPTLDHVVEGALGGTGDVRNLRLAHRVCNEERGVKFNRDVLQNGEVIRRARIVTRAEAT